MYIYIYEAYHCTSVNAAYLILPMIFVVIELEPLNETAAQFYPLIQERIKLGKT